MNPRIRKLERDIANLKRALCCVKKGGTGDGEEDESTGIYNLASPTTETVGNLQAGTDISGWGIDEILQQMLISYLFPTFNSFSIQGQSQTLEVGESITGTVNFQWSNTNIENIEANSISISDTTLGETLVTGLSPNGSQSFDLSSGVYDTDPVFFNAPMSWVWRVTGINTEGGAFNRNFTVQAIYPYFWGKVASGGAMPGDNRPTPSSALIDSGTKVLAPSTGTITINFGSVTDDYIWFAIPEDSPNKTRWFVDNINQGNMGGAVDPFGNLFPNPVTLPVDSPTALWNGVPYKIYVSNYQTESTAPMQLRNS